VLTLPPRLTALALGLTLVAWRGAGAEPEVPVPQAARDRYDQGQELEKQGRTAEAVSAYQEAIRLGMERYPRVHLKEAGGYLKLQDYDAAIARYTRFIENFGLEDSCRY
jgi:tetratricopeptide (TPR) repeat protein